MALLLLLAIAGLCDLVSPFHCSCQARAALRTWSAFLASTKQLARLCVFTERSMLPHYSLHAFQPSAMPPSVCLQLAQLTNLVVPSFSPSSYPPPHPHSFSYPNLSPPLPSLLVLAGPSAAACSVFSKLLPPSPLASLSTPAVQLGINPISSSALSLLYSCAVFVLYELLLIRYVVNTAPSGFGIYGGSALQWGQGSGMPEAVGPTRARHCWSG